MKRRLLQRIRVPLGTLAAVFYFLFARPGTAWMAAGLVPLLAGVFLRLWAAGHIRKNEDLARSGPYRFTRNPLYLGSFLMGAGLGIQSGIWWLAPVFLPLFLAVYLTVMKQEEKDLEKRFGERFREFRGRVPLFLPRPGRSLPPGEGTFSIRRAWKNREYNALLGTLAAEGALLAKAAWPSVNLFR